MKNDFLLEIGCEEIPARMLPAAQRSLGGLLTGELTSLGLLKKGGKIQTWSTPRRLAAYCKTLTAVEPDKVEEVTGPPWSAAFDSEGKPTRAAEGFASKTGVPLKQLKKITTPKGDYLAAVIRHKGLKTKDILADILPGVIQKIQFPRKMYWTSPGSTQFIRPIRWVVTLFDNKPVPFTVGDVRSSRASRGHRKLYNRTVTIREARRYEAVLRKAGVVVDPSNRKKKIETEAAGLLRKPKLRLKPDPDLLETLVNMTEHPTVMLGEFPKEFLELPEEVLITVMRHHQHYLSVGTTKGVLAPNFIAVLDRDKDRGGRIRSGHEAVLVARFRDAQFFWEVDQQHTLEEIVESLDKVTFHSKLGSYGAKVARLEKLARWLAENSEVGCRRADIHKSGKRGGRHADIANSTERRRADIEAVARAARLSKSDLATQLVGEFPELQGIVGGLYSHAQGETESVSWAIREHYQPAGTNDDTPVTPEGCVLAIADKLDTVVGCFAVGESPTGSRDPLGLRRAAYGIVRIILENGVRLDIFSAIRQAIGVVASESGGDTDEALAGVMEFMEERARYYFREARGFPYDEVNAVFAPGWADLPDLEARLLATHAIRPTPDFEPLAAAFKRIKNILEQAGGSSVFAESQLKDGLLEDGAERELHSRFVSLQGEVSDLRSRQEYAEALRRISSIRPAVDLFFDNVLVNTDDSEVRRNRLTLLARLLAEFSSVADFSEIVTT